MNHFNNTRTAIVRLILAACAASQVFADEQRSPTTYGAEFFAGLNVLTAKDMVNRIPGSEAQLATTPGGGNQRRGLRDKTDQILIDGQRFTGKSNEAERFLERLPADKVVRIEVYDGIVVENEAEAGARTINVITTGESAGSGTWRVGARYLQDLRTTGVADLNYSGKFRSVRFNLGMESVPNGSLTHRFDSKYVDNTEIERSLEERRRFAHKTRVTGSAHAAFTARRSLQLNFLYERQPRRGSNHVNIFDIAADGTSSEAAQSQEPLERTVQTMELGGTYERVLSDDNRFQILFLHNTNENDRESRKATRFATGETELNHEIRDERSAETVLRGTWYRTGPGDANFDVGIEFAVNTLDKRLGLFEGSAEPLDPVFIPNADQEIREDRIEVFANYSRAISRIDYRLGIAMEYSEFDQQGSDVALTRTLSYVKPSFDFSFNESDRHRWFVTIKRDVSQLNFDDFVASIDPVDREIRAGNPNLVPETSWNLEVGFENHISDDAGLAKVRVFHHWVSDVADLVPLPPDNYQPGNLADGRRWGVNLVLGWRLDEIGLPGAVFNGFYTWQDSTTTDPFTGEERRILDQRRYEAGFEYRHDVARVRGAYGLKWSFEGDRLRHEHDRIDRNENDDSIELFFEKRLSGSLILSLSLNQISEPKSTRFRRSFEPDRPTGGQVGTEHRDQVLRRFATVTISGSF